MRHGAFMFRVIGMYVHGTAWKNGALDVDKDSCYLTLLSQTINDEENGAYWTCVEETMPIHAINSLLNPASSPVIFITEKLILKKFSSSV